LIPGPWWGSSIRDDQWHDRVKPIFARLPVPLLTCEAVLSEADYLLGSCKDRLWEFWRRGGFEVVPIFPKEGIRITNLLEEYSPRIQLADAGIVRLSEMWPKAKVFTTDTTDFQIYRRNRNQPIPLFPF
jgi:hypothetical protein